MYDQRFVEIFCNDALDTVLAAVVSTVKQCRARIVPRWPVGLSDLADAFLVLGHVDFQNELEVSCARSFLKRAKTSDRFPVIIVIGTNLLDDAESIEKQKEFFDLGVLEILERPLNLQRLRYVIESQKIKYDFWQKNQSLESKPTASFRLTERLQKQLNKVSAVDTNLILTGETGVGKTYWAEYIHRHSARAKHPFVVVNCSNFTSTLVESQLFGHNKGAFTGADQTQIGRFEYAGAGTILLDEVDSLPPEVQAKLLRVVENHEFSRVGGNQPIPMKARILSASNRNLEELVQNRTFREDLYYRLNVYDIHIPPLRDRRSEIESLCHLFAEEFAKSSGQKAKSFDAEVIKLLLNYRWPGNLRELRNCVQHGAIDADNSIIRVEHLPNKIRKDLENQTNAEAQMPVQQPMPEERTSEFNEVRRLVNALEHNDYNRSKTAEELGVSRMTVYNMLKRHSLG
jgi:DNA-binding NtrC family response regulator